MITGTTFAYYHYCLKRMWLFHYGINMEQTSEIVADGKINHDYTKNRRNSKYKELSLGRIKIDFYDDKNNIIYENKRNFKNKEHDQWQLKYYMYVFYISGNKTIRGILEYPKNKKLFEISLDSSEIEYIENSLIKIDDILKLNCPEMNCDKRCKNCSYLKFCEA
jgi:CRISPR-associated exonuclease Cas4